MIYHTLCVCCVCVCVCMYVCCVFVHQIVHMYVCDSVSDQNVCIVVGMCYIYRWCMKRRHCYVKMKVSI